jgi:hypothetical protein
VRENSQEDINVTIFTRLARHDVDSFLAARIRDRACTILDHRLRQKAAKSGIMNAYSRFLEPALVSTFVVSYLTWTLTKALPLLPWLR